MGFFCIWRLMQGSSFTGIAVYIDQSSTADGQDSIAKCVIKELRSLTRRRRSATLTVGSLFLLSGLCWYFFERAINTTNPAAAIVLYEFHPTIIILLLAFTPLAIADRQRCSAERQGIGQLRTQPLCFNKFFLVILSGCGVALVSLGQSESFTFDDVLDVSYLALLAAMLTAAQSVITIRLPHWLGMGDRTSKERVAGSLYLRAVQNVVIGLLTLPFLMVALSSSDGFGISDVLLPSLGAFLSAFAWRYYLSANQLMIDKPAINALYNIVPVQSLMWVGVFVGVEIARTSWFVVGTVAIIVANVLLQWAAVFRERQHSEV